MCAISHYSLSDAKTQILAFKSADVRLLGIQLIANAQGYLKCGSSVDKADSGSEVIKGSNTIDLNSKFDIKNFKDVNERENSFPSDRDRRPLTSQSGEGDIRASPSPQDEEGRAKNGVFELESCSSLSSSMLDVTKHQKDQT
jgi:hypothetical protein